MTIDPAILVGVFRDLGINLSASVIFEFLKSRFGKSLGVEQSTFEHELSAFLKIHGVQSEAATVIKALADSGFLSIKGAELVAPDGILIGAGEGARFSFGEGSASKTTKTAIHANGNARAALSNYRSGKPIGTSRDQYERVGHLLGIHKNLRLLFPQNRDLAYRWMTTRNKAFDNLTPVDVVKEWCFAGLLMVRGYLDRARGV